MIQSPGGKTSLNSYLAHTAYRIMPVLTPKGQSLAIIICNKVQMKQQHAGLAMVPHQVKSCCISLFLAQEYLTHLIPLLLFSFHLLTSDATQLSLPEPGGKVGQAWFPLAPMGQQPGGGKHKLQARDYQRKLPVPPWESVTEQPMDNMSLICKTQILSKIQPSFFCQCVNCYFGMLLLNFKFSSTA